MDKSNIYFNNGKKNLRENAQWNVNKTIGYLVRNKIKHWKKVQDREISDTLGQDFNRSLTRQAS
jgi:hypothetical protein